MNDAVGAIREPPLQRSLLSSRNSPLRHSGVRPDQGGVIEKVPLRGYYPQSGVFTVIPAKAGIQSRRGYRTAGRPRKTKSEKTNTKAKSLDSGMRRNDGRVVRLGRWGRCCCGCGKHRRAIPLPSIRRIPPSPVGIHPPKAHRIALCYKEALEKFLS